MLTSKKILKCTMPRTGTDVAQICRAEPKTYTQDMYIVQLIGKILSDGSSLAKVIKAFKAHHEKVANKMNGVTLKRAVSGIAAKRLVKKVLLLRRHHVGALLRAVRSINKLEIKSDDDFGEGLHTIHSEPYYYEAAYTFAPRASTLVVDESGRCRPHDVTVNTPKQWKCGEKCKPLAKSEVCTLLKLQKGF